jgi:hypothetical protein
MNKSMPPSQALPFASAAKLSQWRTSETQVILERLSQSLLQALADHQAMLGILLQRRDNLPLEIGELLEDASNAYMEMSERVSEKFLMSHNQIPG